MSHWETVSDRETVLWYKYRIKHLKTITALWVYGMLLHQLCIQILKLKITVMPHFPCRPWFPLLTLLLSSPLGRSRACLDHQTKTELNPFGKSHKIWKLTIMIAHEYMLRQSIRIEQWVHWHMDPNHVPSGVPNHILLRKRQLSFVKPIKQTKSTDYSAKV